MNKKQLIETIKEINRIFYTNNEHWEEDMEFILEKVMKEINEEDGEE